jgi:hypothetical protein
MPKEVAAWRPRRIDKVKRERAGGNPPKDDWFFINEQGTWVIKKDGAGGLALYIWPEDEPHEYTLEYVSEVVVKGAVLTRPKEEHHGWAYKCARADFWFFFSDTALYTTGSFTYYPLYYSKDTEFSNIDKKEFRRFVTPSWTLGFKRP